MTNKNNTTTKTTAIEKKNYVEELIVDETYTQVGKSVICTIALKNGFEHTTYASAYNENKLDFDKLKAQARHLAINEIAQKYERYRIQCEISNFYGRFINAVETDKEGNEKEFADDDIKTVKILPRIGKKCDVVVTFQDGTEKYMLGDMSVVFRKDDKEAEDTDDTTSEEEEVKEEVVEEVKAPAKKKSAAKKTTTSTAKKKTTKTTSKKVAESEE